MTSVLDVVAVVAVVVDDCPPHAEIEPGSTACEVEALPLGYAAALITCSKPKDFV